MAGLVLSSRIIKALGILHILLDTRKIIMLVYGERDGDISFWIHIAVSNTDLKLLNFSSKDQNLLETVNEERSGS